MRVEAEVVYNRLVSRKGGVSCDVLLRCVEYVVLWETEL